MTIDERLEQIQHVTAALAEERRKDREEYKSLWRDTQRQINENAKAIGELRIFIHDLAEQAVTDREQAATDRAEARAAEAELRARVAALVSGFGEYMRRSPASPKP